LTKTGLTTFDVTYKNYTPTRNVDVVIEVKPAPG
jgi:hypothetical protein